MEREKQADKGTEAPSGIRTSYPIKNPKLLAKHIANRKKKNKDKDKDVEEHVNSVSALNTEDIHDRGKNITAPHLMPPAPPSSSPPEETMVEVGGVGKRHLIVTEKRSLDIQQAPAIGLRTLK